MQSVLFPQMDVWSPIAWAESPTDRQKQSVPQSAPAWQALHEPPIRRREKCVSLHKSLIMGVTGGSFGAAAGVGAGGSSVADRSPV